MAWAGAPGGGVDTGRPQRPATRIQGSRWMYGSGDPGDPRKMTQSGTRRKDAKGTGQDQPVEYPSQGHPPHPDRSGTSAGQVGRQGPTWMVCERNLGSRTQRSTTTRGESCTAVVVGSRRHIVDGEPNVSSAMLSTACSSSPSTWCAVGVLASLVAVDAALSSGCASRGSSLSSFFHALRVVGVGQRGPWAGWATGPLPWPAHDTPPVMPGSSEPRHSSQRTTTFARPFAAVVTVSLYGPRRPHPGRWATGSRWAGG
jgi:hypothetical protein